MPGPTDDLCRSRRAVLQALAGAVLLPGVLVACSSGDEESSDGTASGGTASGAASAGSIPVAEVPVGQARVVSAGGAPVVVAQPAEGQFVAFTAVCTHQGTTVVAGDGLTLTCPSHGSRFDAASGTVANGPATEPLAPVPVTRQGDSLVLG